MNDALYPLPDTLRADLERHDADVRLFLAGELAADLFKARRVPRGLYEQRRDGTYMSRVRVAAGVLTPAQATVLGELARTCADGVLHVTTRQDFQLHNVHIEDTPALLQRLLAAGLPARGGGGNTVRNVTACPFAGVCPCEHLDVTPCALAVTSFLIGLEGSYTLPRKFKIAMSGCAADCAFAAVNDLGFVATVRDGEPGFRLFGGGGMGAASRIGDELVPFLPAADVLRAAEAGRRLFDRIGERKDRHRARLRHAAARLGTEEFVRRFAETLAEVRADATVPAFDAQRLAGVPAPAAGPPRVEVHGGLSLVSERQRGRVTLCLHLPLGHLSGEDLAALGGMAAEFSEERTLRATQGQHLLLRGVPRARLNELADRLRGLSQDLVTFRPLHAFVACTGAATCKLGLCLSREAARSCARALEENPRAAALLREVDIRVSGCPNCCGQHPLGGIGLSGASRREGERLVPGYRVQVGARRGAGQTRFGVPLGFVPAKRLPAFLVALLHHYAAERRGGEALADYVERVGTDALGRLVAAHAAVPSPDEDPDAYRDWGCTADFSLAGRGPGECGAGVLEIVEQELQRADAAVAAARGGGGAAAVACRGQALGAAVRGLLITRGVDSPRPAERLAAFRAAFVESGLVPARFASLLVPDASPAQAEVEAFVAHARALYGTLDARLQFHPEQVGGGAPSDAAPAAPPGDGVLDLGGVPCPLNFVKARLALEALPSGARLELLLDDGEPLRRVPASFRQEGFVVAAPVAAGPGRWRVTVTNR